MIYNKSVQKFVDIWLTSLMCDEPDYKHFFSKEFRFECEDLGFKLLSTNETEELYFEEKKLKDVLSENIITDYKELGSVIYSVWNVYLKYYLMDMDTKFDLDEFISLLVHLQFITSINLEEAISKQKSVDITSRLYGENISRSDETKQTLRIYNDGRVTFNGAAESKKLRREKLNIDKEVAKKLIFDLFVFYHYIDFWHEYEIASDWTIEFNGRDEMHELSAEADSFMVNSKNISSTIREIVPIYNMLLFDLKANCDEILRLELNLKDDSDKSIENLIIDKDTSQIIFNKVDDCGNKTSFNYVLNDEVSNLLQNGILDYETYIDEEDNDSNKKLEIKIDYRFLDSYSKTINYNKRCISPSFQAFLKNILKSIQKYNSVSIFGEEINSFFDRDIKYRFANVIFNLGQKSYSYVLEDDSIRIGDFVWVPVGSNYEKKVALVVDINYYTEEEAPYSYKKTKRIIGKCDKYLHDESDIYLAMLNDYSYYLEDSEEIKNNIIENIGVKFPYTLHTNKEKEYSEYTDEDIIIEFENQDKNKNLRVVIGYQLEILFLGHKDVFNRFRLFFPVMLKVIDSLLNSKYGVATHFLDGEIIVEDFYCNTVTPFTSPDELIDMCAIKEDITEICILSINYWNLKSDAEWYITYNHNFDKERYTVRCDKKFYIVNGKNISSIASISELNDVIVIDEFKIFGEDKIEDAADLIEAIYIYGILYKKRKMTIAVPDEIKKFFIKIGFKKSRKPLQITTIYSDIYTDFKIYQKMI